ncbi:hypothetical protein M569_02479, partial [Genlisea aurea]
MLQFSIITCLTRLLHHFLLKPLLQQPLIVAQILGGILLGPSLLGQDLVLFPRKSRLILDTLSVFGFVLFVFLIGVKTDVSIVARSDRRSLAVGICTFFLPLALSGSLSYLLRSVLSLDDDTSRAIPHIVQMLSMTAFPVVTCFLEELGILNSDIGRLASNSSVICDVCVCSTKIVQFVFTIATTADSFAVVLGSSATAGTYVLVVVFLVRPAALWVIRNTPETGPVRESHLLLSIVAILVAGLFGEAIGIYGTVACLVLGLAVPDGPPLGASLVETLESFVAIILLPLFFSVSGLKVDVFRIRNLKNVGALQLIIMASFLGKLLGSLLPLMAYRIPFQDAFSLGLIMNTKGIVELAFLNHSLNQNVVTDEIYSLMIISMVAITGVITPVVKLIYDPSRRYVAYKRRTILHCKDEDEFRILVTVHRQQDVHPMISLLQASHPTQHSPINLVVLHLVKLMGRSSSLLVAHRTPDEDEEKLPRTQTERIFNAFKKLEQGQPGLFRVDCYKGISPYTMMHNDVCSLALEKRIILIILPFSRKSGCDATSESNHTFRRINRSVLEQAPCSVGILIDHPYLRASHLMKTKTSEFQLAMLFFGGPDDREALGYARRIAKNNSARLKIIRITSSGHEE